MNWPLIIDDVLRRCKINQEELAYRAGCSQSLISRLRTGKTREPGYSVGAAIMELTYVSEEWFQDPPQEPTRGRSECADDPGEVPGVRA